MPRSITLSDDPVLLAAALEGLELQKQRLEQQIQQIRVALGRRRPAESAEAAAGKKRQLSEAARKRIAAAQKRRWAEYRKAGSPKTNKST